MTAWQAGVPLGPYVLVSPIGSGGMGEVWKARDTRLDRVVAIKRLKGEHSARFEQEARAIAALNHPHICQIHDIGPDYLVLEYVEGAALKGPLPVEEAVRLAIQIAGALEEAHGRGILHRDLKPANIMVTERGAAKLLDFGLAKLMTSEDSDVTLTAEGTVLGTAAYMAPEQAQGKALDERSDIFSFGAVLYEVLSGRRAFRGDSMAEVLSAVLRDDPKPPPALAGIVMRCLRKVPEERFQTMAEVRAALAGQAEGLPHSIAVLPFADMSPGKDNEYFSDGLAEEIINALAQIPGLKVIARTSAFAFKGQNTDIRRIAEALGVVNVLEGSVRKAGNRIRVTTQLITAADGSHLWSQRYDRDMADVFAVQDEIAQAIAGALQVKLSATPAAHRRYTPNLPAYEAFLKARHYWAKLTPESLARSRECYEQAIALDPQFALARSFLGEHFFALAANGLMSAHEAMPQVRAGALQAVEMDPSLPEPHALLGAVAAVYDYDWAEAGRRFRLAMARQPIPTHVRMTYAALYCHPNGRLRDGEEELRRALQEDPLHLLCRGHLAGCLAAAGNYPDAFRQLQQILEIDENYYVAHWYLSIMHAVRGMVPEALASSERAYALAPWNTIVVGLRAGMLARTGDLNGAEPVLAQLRPGEAYGAPVGWAVFHLVCLEIDKAADWMEKAMAQRDTRLFFLLRPYFQTSSRWPALAKMMNLPETVS